MELIHYRNAAHYLAGIITSLSVLVDPVLVIGGLLIFLIYQLNEDRWEKDRAYRDIREYAVAFFSATSAIIAWRVVL